MSRVPRSMEATTAPETAAVERRRKTMPSGWWGIALLIATELTLFGSLIATYFYLRFSADSWPPPGVADPSVALPLVLTGVLILSCLPVFAAVRAASSGLLHRARRLLALALCIEAAYLGAQIALFARDLGDFSPRDDAYGSIYFTLLGVHHAHVAVGLMFGAWVLARLIGGLTNYRLVALQVFAFYSYFVAAIAVFVVLTQLYPSL